MDNQNQYSKSGKESLWLKHRLRVKGFCFIVFV